MASAESDYLVNLYRSWTVRMTAAPEMDLATLRDIFEEWHLPTREPEGVSYAQVDAGGVGAMWCIPEGCAADRVLFYSHGGGFVVGSMHSHRKLAGHMAKAAGTRALVVDFRRAPENPFPAQLEDAVIAFRWLLGQGVRPEHVATTGDSAGGNLSVTLPLKLRDEGVPLPAAVMPMSPWLDMEVTGESLQSRVAVDALVTMSLHEAMVSMFLGEARRDDPLANPLHADLTALPPMLIQVGDHETLLDDSVRLAQLAQKAGVEVVLEVAPEMQHVFQFMAGRASEADEAIARMAAWVRPRLGLV